MKRYEVDDEYFTDYDAALMCAEELVEIDDIADASGVSVSDIFYQYYHRSRDSFLNWMEEIMDEGSNKAIQNLITECEGDEDEGDE